jgi:hypothetical protein
MDRLLAKLQGTDRRSIGRSEEVVDQVLADPGQFRLARRHAHAGSGGAHGRRGRRREAHPPPSGPAARAGGRLLSEVAAIVQQEVRWHLAQLLPRLALTEQQRTRAVVILSGFLDDDSRTVRTFAMPALADLAQGDERLRRRVLPLLTELTRTGTPAMRSRGRKLLARLQRADR